MQLRHSSRVVVQPRRSSRVVVLKRSGARVLVRGLPAHVLGSGVDHLTGGVRLHVRLDDGTDARVPVQWCQANGGGGSGAPGFLPEAATRYDDLTKLECHHKRAVHTRLLAAARATRGPRDTALVLDSTYMTSSRILRHHFGCQVDVPNPQACHLEDVPGVRKHACRLGEFVGGGKARPAYDIAFLDFCGMLSTCAPEIEAALPRLRPGATLGVTITWRGRGAGPRAAEEALLALLRRCHPDFELAFPPYLYGTMLFVCGWLGVLPPPESCQSFCLETGYGV